MCELVEDPDDDVRRFIVRALEAAGATGVVLREESEARGGPNGEYLDAELAFTLPDGREVSIQPSDMHPMDPHLHIRTGDPKLPVDAPIAEPEPVPMNPALARTWLLDLSPRVLASMPAVDGDGESIGIRIGSQFECVPVPECPEVLVLFESSGRIRQAFRDRGFEAWSCDLLPADDGSPYHHQGDAIALLKCIRHADLIVMHPECTALSVSGNHKYAAGKPDHQLRLDAVAYVERLWSLARSKAEHVCLENPVGVLPSYSTLLPKPAFIQPYEFGEDASKKTGLYLHGLPKPVGTERIAGRITPEGKERWSNQTDSGQNRLGPSDDRWKLRSATYPGIADALADQWMRVIRS